MENSGIHKVVRTIWSNYSFVRETWRNCSRSCFERCVVIFFLLSPYFLSKGWRSVRCDDWLQRSFIDCGTEKWFFGWSFKDGLTNYLRPWNLVCFRSKFSCEKGLCHIRGHPFSVPAVKKYTFIGALVLRVCSVVTKRHEITRPCRCLKGTLLGNVKSLLPDLMRLYWVMSCWKTYTQKGFAK